MNATVAVATMTLARSDEEEALLRRSLAHLSATGLRVAVADASCRPGFTRFLEELPGFTVVPVEGSGLVAQISASLSLAASRAGRFVLYTEPDKEWFLGPGLASFVNASPDSADIGVVLAARSRSGFATFPPMQQYVEDITNTVCQHFTGVRGDYSYGPFLMTRELAYDAAAAPRDLGWGWRPFAFKSALRRGLRIEHVEGDYPCPDDQRNEDDAERSHRLRQLAQNLAGLIA